MRIARVPFVLFVLIAASASAASPEAPIFNFRSNVWINLHHVLRAAVRGMPLPAELTPAERERWDAAVSEYRRYAERHVLFDTGMIAIKNALSEAPDVKDLPEIPGEPELDELLESVAPIYRRHWWPAHDAVNHSWIAAAGPLLERYGRTIAKRVAAAYGEPWPSKSISVDVTVVGGPVGAYTTTRPTHVIMPSMDRGYLGLGGLEMLFHEPSHQWGRRLQTILTAAAEAEKKKIPPQLWHAVLFYNAGENTRRALEEDGIGSYREYAVAQNVYRNLCGEGCRDRVADHWNRRLAGEATLEEALRALVKAWPVDP